MGLRRGPFVSEIEAAHTDMASHRRILRRRTITGASFTAPEDPLSDDHNNAVNENVTVTLRLEDESILKISISGAATFDVLHEECVKHANKYKPLYTIDNTLLELGTLERYHDIFQQSDILLKSLDPEKKVRSYERHSC